MHTRAHFSFWLFTNYISVLTFGIKEKIIALCRSLGMLPLIPLAFFTHHYLQILYTIMWWLWPGGDQHWGWGRVVKLEDWGGWLGGGRKAMAFHTFVNVEGLLSALVHINRCFLVLRWIKIVTLAFLFVLGFLGTGSDFSNFCLEWNVEGMV